MPYSVTLDEPVCGTVAQPVATLKIAGAEMTNPPHERGAWLIQIREVSPKDRKHAQATRRPPMPTMQPFKPQSVQKDSQYNHRM